MRKDFILYKKVLWYAALPAHGFRRIRLVVLEEKKKKSNLTWQFYCFFWKLRQISKIFLKWFIFAILLKTILMLFTLIYFEARCRHHYFDLKQLFLTWFLLMKLATSHWIIKNKIKMFDFSFWTLKLNGKQQNFR